MFTFKKLFSVACGGWAGMGQVAAGAAVIVTQLVLNKLRECI